MIRTHEIHDAIYFKDRIIETMTTINASAIALIIVPQEGPDAGTPMFTEVASCTKGLAEIVEVAETIRKCFATSPRDVGRALESAKRSDKPMLVAVCEEGFGTPIVACVAFANYDEKANVALYALCSQACKAIETSKKSRFHEILSTGLKDFHTDYLFESISESIKNGLYCDEVGVWKVDGDFLIGASQSVNGVDLHVGESYAGKQMLLGNNKVVEDLKVLAKSGELERGDWIASKGFRSAIFLPIYSQDGTVGVVAVLFKRPHGATLVDLQLSEYVVHYFEKFWQNSVEILEARRQLVRLQEFEDRYVDFLLCMTGLHDIPSIHEQANRALDSIEVKSRSNADLHDHVTTITQALDTIADLIEPHKKTINFAKDHYADLQKTGSLPIWKRAKIVDVVNRQIDLYGALIREREIEIKPAIQAPPMGLKFDPGDVETVVRNCLQNSIRSIETKSFGKGRIEISIAFDTLSVDRNEVAIIITISDNGVGVSKEDLGKVLQPGFTTYRGAGGRGYGLAIVDTICKKHGYAPKVSSKFGYEFTLTATVRGRT